MTSDTGSSGDSKLSGMEQMMLRDLERVKPSNDTILQNCELPRRDLARMRENSAKVPKPARN